MKEDGEDPHERNYVLVNFNTRSTCPPWERGHGTIHKLSRSKQQVVYRTSTEADPSLGVAGKGFTYNTD